MRRCPKAAIAQIRTHLQKLQAAGDLSGHAGAARGALSIDPAEATKHEESQSIGSWKSCYGWMGHVQNVWNYSRHGWSRIPHHLYSGPDGFSQSLVEEMDSFGIRYTKVGQAE